MRDIFGPFLGVSGPPFDGVGPRHTHASIKSPGCLLLLPVLLFFMAALSTANGGDK